MKIEKSSISNKNISNIGINNQKNIYKEKEIYKRIKNKLFENNKEKLITRFIISSLLSLVILLAIGGFLLYIILSNLTALDNNLLSIIYSINLRYYTNMGIYYIREMDLLVMNESISDNKLYSNFLIIQNRTDYLQNIKDKLKENFFAGHQNMESMLDIKLNLNKNNSFYLNLKPFKTKINSGPFQNKYITSTLLVSIVQIYSFFFHLIISENMKNSKEEIYNFMYNAMNNVGIGIKDLVNIYLSEIIIKPKTYIILSGIILIIIFFIYIGLYFLIKITHTQIMKRKESYISIFYDIDLSIIRESMTNCERYIRIINPNESLIFQEKYEDNEDSKIDSKFEEDFEYKKESNKNNNYKNKLNNSKKKQCKDISKYWAFRIKILIVLFFSFFYMLIILWKFINLINLIKIIGLYIYHMQNLHNNLLNLYIAYREFIFCKDSEMYNMNIFDYLAYAEKELYENLSPDINFIADNCYKIEGLSNIFSEVQKSQICSNLENSNNKITNIEICDYYMKVITSLGFYSYISVWTEEIRIKKKYVLNIDKKNNAFFSNDNILKYESRIIELFNSQEIHNHVNFMFTYVILPYINKERKITINKIMEKKNSMSQIFIIYIIIYFSIIIIFYIFFWKILLNNTKNLIYNSKKMLAIIPVEILSTQTNIKDLIGILDIND